MLHRIELVCTKEFGWITNLQRDLLTALCSPRVNKNVVTEDWIASIRPDIGTNWIKRLCNRSLIKCMQVISESSTLHKKQILSNFKNNLNFEIAFNNANYQPHPLNSISSILEENLRGVVREYFIIFYELIFCRCGYQIPINNRTAVFTRKSFVERYREINRLNVCVFCDSSLGDPDVDHFYPKNKYPDLSCHAANLVPICKSCNGRARKGVQIPLDADAKDPMLNWFHPYYRSAEGCYQVNFVETNGKICPSLESEDSLSKKRLDNLNKLISLTERWHQDLNYIVRITINKLGKKIKPDKIRKDELQNKLKEWADSAEYEIGLSSGYILKEAYYRHASKRHPLLFEEIWISITKADPLTGAKDN